MGTRRYQDELPDILPPSEDGIFKSTFTRAEAKPALLELLSDVLDRPLTDVVIQNNVQPVKDVDAKEAVFDISCFAEGDHAQMDVEMAATPMEGDNREGEHLHLRNRAVYNLCDLHAGQLGRGVRYGDFYSSYQIMICNFKVFDWDNELIEWFTYRNASGRQLSDITSAIFLDLTQARKIIKKPVGEMSGLEQWVVFLAKAGDPKCREVVQAILKQKGGISVAYEMLTTISKDADERARFRSRRMWQMDRAHEMAAARIQGEERERAKWEKVVADRDAENTLLRDQLAALQRQLNERG
jgi:predicted transposase/invertase (TIGR01784 family)